MKNKLLKTIYMLSRYFLYGFMIQLLFLNFGLAVNANGQYKSIEEVNIQLSSEELTVGQFFREVQRQTPFKFSYDSRKVDRMTPLTFSDRAGILEGFLVQAAMQGVLSFRQYNHSIDVLKDEKETVEIIEEIDPVLINGTVTDSKNEPLIGATISIKGTSSGTVTDVDGNFSIAVPEGGSIIISYIGFESQTISIRSQTIFSIVLLEDSSSLDEVVVVGYGTQKKGDITGSVVRANIEAFRESPNVNIAQSLQGTVPGLNIGQVTRAGENPSISVRGRTTLSGNQNVLIVVDGIIFMGSLSDLNPADIESIDILKDASSMAIFGAQAANGVILISTKEGRMEQKPIFNYAGSVTTQSPSNRPKLYDREGFINKARDQDWEIGFLPPEYTQPNPDYNPGELFDPELFRGYDDGTDFDWWDASTQAGYITNHNLSVRGANSQTSYFVSAGYTKQEGIIMNDQFERFTARINLEHQILDWFKFGFQTFGSFSDFSGEIPSMGAINTMSPLVRPFDDDGNVILNPDGSNRPNPFLVTYSDDFDKRNNLFGNVYLGIEMPFLKGLNYRVNLGNNYSWRRHYRSNVYAAGASGEAFKRQYHSYDWTLDNIINYRTQISGNHSLDATFVFGRRELDYEDTRADGTNYNNLILGYNDLSLGQLQLINSAAWDESYLYQTARLNYDILGKYLFTGTIRRDGFSGFSEENKFGVFPSLGFGWVISDESFIDQPWIDIVKFRGSYGTNGNLTSRYSSLARVAFYPAYVFGDGGSTAFGQYVNTLANSNLKWETTTGVNFGIDYSLLNRRITGSIDYYQNTTNDLLFNVNLPEITGFSNISTNIGEIANRGIEVIINAEMIRKGDFLWNLNLNFASNRNRIVSLLGIDSDGDSKEDDLIGSNLFIGESINSIFTYESAGIIQIGEETPPGFFVGTHRIVDQNDDGIIDAFDRVVIGRQEPAYNFGILNEVHYKNFTFRFFLNSIQGGSNGYLGINEPSLAQDRNARRANLFVDADYWTPSNPNARYRGIHQEAGVGYSYFGNRSFFRLQDVTLAYRFDKSVAEKLGLGSAKLFVNGKNLATWTNWVGWDPETGSGLQPGGLPVLRGVSVGLDISF